MPHHYFLLVIFILFYVTSCERSCTNLTPLLVINLSSGNTVIEGHALFECGHWKLCEQQNVL